MLSLNNESKAAATMFLNFSGLLKREILDIDGKFLGKVWDVAAKFGEIYPTSQELVIRKGFLNRQYAAVAWSSIAELGDDIRLNIKSEKLQFAPVVKEFEFLLKRDILDQQIVDTYNHKVRRVNDIHLLRVDHLLMVAHVEIGLRGIIRRLGWENIVDFLLRLINKEAPYLHKEDLVSWKFVQPIAVNPASMTMKLSLSQKQLLSIPPADLGDLILDLNLNQRMALFKSLDLKTKARIFENLEFEDQKLMLKELDKREAAQIVTNMSSDEAADLLEKLPANAAENLLTLMESNRAKKLAALLGYATDSAGGLMTTEFVSMPEDATVASTIEYIKNQTRELETVFFIYIVDDKNHLKGITTVRRLLFANPQDGIISSAFPKPLFVHLNDSVKEVAYMMDKYKVAVLPVVDENKILHGIITMDDILSQVISIAWRKRPRKPKGL